MCSRLSRGAPAGNRCDTRSVRARLNNVRGAMNDVVAHPPAAHAIYIARGLPHHSTR
jgi:hypothetical protein